MSKFKLLSKNSKEVLRNGARTNFVHFVYYIDYDFFKSRPFLKEIAIAFQQIADGEILTLSVSLPPRAGKSYLSTLFCAWILGKYPQDSVMRNTCTATLARKLSYEAREIVISEKYTDVFPEIRLSENRAAVDGWSTNLAKSVSYFGQGVGGTIIGFGATKVAITDDLFKSIDEAMSETIRDKTHSWKEGTHDSRKESGCAEIDIGTRWTIDDVIGRNSNNKHYDKEIVIPALIDEKSFCEAVMTTEEYLKKRDKSTPEIWQAEYMQNPVDIEGQLFQDIKIFKDLDFIRKNSEGCLAYIDVADEGGDYLCMLIGHLLNGNIYITDVVYSKANTDTTIPTCAQLLNDNKVPYCRVETNGMGAIFLKELRKLVTITDCLGLTNKTNKETRIIMKASYVLRKFHFLEVDKGDYFLYIQGLTKYVKDGRNKNDDAPDATTGLAIMYDVFFPELDS